MTTCPKCGWKDNPYERERSRLIQRGLDLNIYTGGAIREREAAALLGIPFETFRHYRKNLGPDVAPCRYYKNGAGAISYRLDDLAAFCVGDPNLAGEIR